MAERVNNQLIWQKGTHERYDFDLRPKKYLHHSSKNTTSFHTDFVGFRASQRSYLPLFGCLTENMLVSVYHGSRGFSSGLWSGLILALKSLNLFSYENDGSHDYSRH
jgi:hypothetical protein